MLCEFLLGPALCGAEGFDALANSFRIWSRVTGNRAMIAKVNTWI